MAYAYTVHGSEDGVVAVCGNKKRALEKAIEYVRQTSEEFEIVKSGDWVTYVRGYRVTATVEKYWLE
jgi:hypothetical protein